MVCAKPVQILHFYQPMIYVLIYGIFTVIYHLAGADPIYDPLDWADTGNTAIVGLVTVFVVVPVIHIFIFFSLYTLRVYVSQKCCHESTRVGQEPETVNQELPKMNNDAVDSSATPYSSSNHNNPRY